MGNIIFPRELDPQSFSSASFAAEGALSPFVSLALSCLTWRIPYHLVDGAPGFLPGFTESFPFFGVVSLHLDKLWI